MADQDGQRETAASRLPPETYAGYASGGFGLGIYATVPSLLLLFYMTDLLGIAALAAGALIVAPKLFGILIDPVIGRLSDQTRSRLGRRRPWMLAGALITTVSFCLLFRAPPSADPQVRLLYIALVFAASSLGYSLFSVPYVAMAAEISRDPAVRARLMAWRMTAVLLGILVGGAGAPAIIAATGGGLPGYGAMSAGIGAVCGLALVVAVIGTRKAPAPPRPTRPAGFGVTLRAVSANRRFRLLTAIYLSQAVAASLASTLLPYLATHLLGETEARVGTLFLAYVAASVIGVPAWLRIAARLGKRQALIMATAASALLSLGLITVAPGYPLWLLHTQMVAAGFCFAALQLMPAAMLTDVLQMTAIDGGSRSDGVYTGVFTSTEKLGLALGPLVAAGFLSATGYIPVVAGSSFVQPAAVVDGIRLALAVPSLLLAGSMLLIARYGLDEADLRRQAALLPEAADT